jgi:hypothetical protein
MDKMNNINPHTPEELKNFHHKISTISGEELLRVNNNVYTVCIWSGGKYFSTCCSTADFRYTL